MESNNRKVQIRRPKKFVDINQQVLDYIDSELNSHKNLLDKLPNDANILKSIVVLHNEIKANQIVLQCILSCFRYGDLKNDNSFRFINQIVKITVKILNKYNLQDTAIYKQMDSFKDELSPEDIDALRGRGTSNTLSTFMRDVNS